MSKKILSHFAFSILLLIANVTKAQNDSIAPYDEVYTFDSAAFQPDLCYKPSLVSSSVAYYGTTAWAVVEIDTPTPLNASYWYYLYESGVQVGSPVQASGKYLQFSSLDANKLYTLKVMNACAQQEVFTLINTTFTPDDEVVYLSQKMMTAFNHWVTDSTKKQINIYSYVNSLTNVHLIEKVSVLQHWAMTTPLPAFTAGTMPPASYFNLEAYNPPPGTDACNCKLTLSFTPIATEAKAQTVTNKTSTRQEGIIEQYAGTADAGWGNGYEIRGDHRNGASKYMQFKAQRFDGGYNQTEWLSGNSSDPKKGVNSGYILMNLVCLNPLQKPEECGCPRQFSYQYQYDTDTKAESKTVLNNCISGCEKTASAEVEDAAFFMIRDFNTGAPEFLDAGRNMSTSISNISFDKDFGIQTTHLLAKVAGVVVGIYGGTLDASTIITQLESAFVDMFNLPNRTKGSSSNTSFRGTLLSGSGIVTLNPSQPKELIVFSQSRIKLDGRKAFWANGRIESDYFLSVRGDGTTDPNDPTCCAPVVGAYILGSDLTAPQSKTQLRTIIKAHLNLWPTWQTSNGGLLSSIDYDFGAMRGLANGCNTEVIFPKIGNTEPNGEKTNGAKAVVSNNTITIELDNDKKVVDLNKSQNTICNYKLYDVSGRLIKSGSITETQSIWDLSTTTSGIYFVTIEVKGLVKTQKIAVVK